MSRVLRALAFVLPTLLLAAAALLGPSAAAAEPGAPTAVGLPNPHFIRLQVDAITPSTIGSSSTGPLTVTGEIVNDGDRDVRNLQVRLERAPAVRSATELRTALRTSPTDSAVFSPFTTFATRLSPGQSAPFSVTVALRGPADSSLALTEPGVYPMTVNVNGVPDFGDRARLDDAHFLLPVLGLPPDPASPAERTSRSAPATPPSLTMLWPLADQPRLLPSAPGAPTLLRDDELASSFAAGGRLDGLLTAVEQRTRPGADPAGALAASLCLAVDPDLLLTAQAMTAGYEVSTPAGSKPGAGAGAAAVWLDRLKALAKGRCVLALPWAQTDINALARASLSALEQMAVMSGPASVSRALGVPVVPDAVWPTGDQLSDRAADDLPALGVKTVFLSGDAVATSSGAALPATTQAVALATGTARPLGAVLLDPPSATALRATGQGSDRIPRLQDALGALAWPAVAAATGPSGDGDAPTTGVPGAVVVAPPQVWTIDGTQAQAVLGELSDLLRSGAATARPLPTVLDESTKSTARAVLDYSVEDAASELAPATTAEIGRVLTDTATFAAALRQDPQSGTSPADLLAPLQLGLLRGASSAPGAPADEQVAAVSRALDQLKAEVAVQAPGGTYTLASAQSPLLLVVRNDLPVAVAVALRLNPAAGLRTGDIGVQTLPARSSRQLQVPTAVSRTGQFAVDVSLVTDTGQRVGSPTRLQVRSTAYGPATAWATAGAAAVLLALVARRLWHRFRGQPDRADKGRLP